MNKKILTLILGMFLLMVMPLASASLFNTYDYDESNEQITVKSGFGIDWLGKDLAKAKLESNTYNCVERCHAVIPVTLLEKGEVVEDIRFYEVNPETGKQTLSDFDNYKIGYAKKGEFLRPLGDKVEAGDYIVEIIGDKEADKIYDWQVKIKGEWIKVWALWGNQSMLENLTSQYKLTDTLDTTNVLDTLFTYNGTAQRNTGETSTANVTSAYNRDHYGIAFYSDFTGNANDKSGFGNDGVVTGATLTEDRFGDSNSAYSFDGVSDYISNNKSLITNYPFTFSAWIYPEDIVSEQLIIQISDSSVSDVGWYLEVEGSFIKMVSRNTAQHKSSVSGLVANKWQYVVGVAVNSTHRTVYLDGVEGTSNTDTSSFSEVNRFSIGMGRDSTPGQPFNGSIDEPLILNRALNSTEVLALYNLLNQSKLSADDGFLGNAMSFNGVGGDVPLLHYKMNDDLATTNVIDYGTGGNNGTATFNTSDNSVTGKINKSFEFDGVGNTVEVLTNTTTLLGNEFSYSFWMNPAITDSNYRNIIGSDWSNQGSFVSYHRNGVITLSLKDEANIEVKVTSTITAGEWVHFTFIYDGTNSIVYKNGVAGDSTAVTNGFAQVGNRIVLGSANFNGSIDDVRIYNKSLTASDITSLYNNGLGTEESSDYVDLGTDINITSETNFSYGGWVKLASVKEDNDGDSRSENSQIIGGRHNEQEFFGIGRDKTIKFLIDDTNIISNALINLNEWTHTVATYSKYNSTHSRGRIYINGSLDIESIFVTDEFDSGQRWIGWESRFETVFAGEMQDIRVYGSEITTEGISKIYNDEVGTFEIYTGYVELNSPADQTTGYETTIDLNCSAYINGGSEGIQNISLYTNRTGSWIIEETQVYGGTNLNETKTFTRPIGNFKWNCKATDSASESGFGFENRTIIQSTTPPVITTTSPFGVINDLHNGQSLNLNYSITTSGTLDTCLYEYNGANNSLTCGGSTEAFNYVTGQNTITIYANDTISNSNSNSTSWEAIIIDLNSPANDTSFIQGVRTFNATLSSQNTNIENVSLLIDGVINQTNTSGIEGIYNFNVDFQTTASHNWTIQAYSTDGDLYTNQTRTINIGELRVTLNSPADDSTIYSNPVTFNASANVTGGTILINMSLWTNETGSWEIKNITDLGANDIFSDFEDGASYLYESDSVKSPPNWSAAGNVCFFGTGASTSLTPPSSTYSFRLSDGGDSGACNGKTLTSLRPTNLEDINYVSFYIYGNTGGGSWEGLLRYLDSSNNTLATDILNQSASWVFIENSSIPSGTKNVQFYFRNPSSVSTRTMWLDEISLQRKVTEYTTTWNRTINDITIWNVQACDSDGDCGFAPSNYTISTDSTAPTISIESPNETFDYLYQNYNLTLNFTATDNGLDTCWYNYNNTNTTISCTNATKVTTYFDYEPTLDNLTVYANDSFNNVGSQTIIWNYIILEVSQVYNPVAVETSSQDFRINYLKDISVSSLSAIFNYDGSPYLAISGCSGTCFESIIDTPIITAEETKLFNWTFVYTNITGSFNLTTKTLTQNVTNLTFYECDVPSGMTINFTTYDESTLAMLNASFEATFSFQLEGGGAVFKEYNFESIEENKSNWQFCLESNNENVTIDAFTSYYTTGYDRRDYIIDGGTIGNFTQNIPLYLEETDETDVVELLVYDQDFTSLEGARIVVQKWIVGQNAYITVGMATTGSGGDGSINLRLYDTFYRFTVIYEDVVVLITEPEKLTSTTKDLPVILGITNPYELYKTISYSLVFDNVTNVTTFTFVDTSGYTQQGCMLVKLRGNVIDTTKYSSCIESVAGVLTYYLSENGTYVITGIIDLTETYGDLSQVVETLIVRIGTPNLIEQMSGAGKVISFLAIGTMAFLGVAAGSIWLGSILVIVMSFGLMKIGFLNITEGLIWTMIGIFAIILFVSRGKK